MIDTIRKDSAGVMGLPAADKVDRPGDRQSLNAAVLVADGDKKTRKQFSAILNKTEYDAVVAGDGHEAIEQFLKKSFDIVFTALKMPGMDGLTVSLHVKATSLNTPVILMIDENLNNIMSRIKAGRIDCVISKPFGSGAIQKAVQYFVAQPVTDSALPSA
jgi:CheY-like chemotaxis protein